MPMSSQVHPVGHNEGGGVAEAANETESRVSVARVPVVPEFAVSPATIAPDPPSVMLEPMSPVQVTPSGEVKVVNVPWYRVISRYCGAAPEAVVSTMVRSPALPRYTTPMPLDGVTNAP